MLWIGIFMNFCTFWRLKITKLTNFKVPKMAKKADLELLKLISRKIRVREKSSNFHTDFKQQNIHLQLKVITQMIKFLEIPMEQSSLKKTRIHLHQNLISKTLTTKLFTKVWKRSWPTNWENHWYPIWPMFTIAHIILVKCLDLKLKIYFKTNLMAAFCWEILQKKGDIRTGRFFSEVKLSFVILTTFEFSRQKGTFKSIANQKWLFYHSFKRAKFQF